MSSHGAAGAKREEKGRNIQVVVRCRPFNTVERKSSYGVIDCDQNRKEVIVKTGGVNDKASRKTYTFDMVFGPAAKQIEVYRSVVCPILDEVIMGYNCTVFAYGQTGTGKTFTMEGERSPDEQFTWEEDPLAGIIPRTLHQIFEKLSENGTEFSVKVSLLEIYNEELFDLLSVTEDVSERLQLFDDPRNKRGVVVKGLEEVTVHNKDEVYQILERGAAKRRTASTLMNAYSSRSHSVFSVTIHMKEITLDGEELVKIGKLNLVDLAGSENIGRSGAVDKRAREAGNINQSLLTLGRVITALVEKRPHVPYRESKLTRILQDSLGGRTKTSIIATVSPSSSNLEESLSTLEYASRAKNIMNKPEVNQKLTKRTLIKEYTEEIERLKRDLAATRDKNGVYLSTENYESMMSQITSHEEQISEYVDKISVMEEELKKVTELFADSKTQLEQCAADLDDKQLRLDETSRNLQETKEKLIEEEFITSELASVQESLYATAGQLLKTVDDSTGDVLGLHDKLDRKKKVEQHNEEIQQSFAGRVEHAFSSMQRCVQEHADKHQRMLSSYSQHIDSLLVTNEAALKSNLSTAESLVGGVRSLVAEGVARSRQQVEQQTGLCRREKESLLELLEAHQQQMEEVLTVRTLMGLSAINELSDALKSSTETLHALAEQVEAMKEVGGSLRRLVTELGGLQDATMQELSALQTEQDKLEDKIRRAQERHQTGMKQLSLQIQQDYTDLRSASRSLQTPVMKLQENISSGCSSVATQASAQADLLLSTSSSLASSLRLSATESQQALEEMKGYCSDLHSSVSGLVEQDLQWSLGARQQVESQTQEQLSWMDKISSEAQNLQQSVETSAAERLHAAGEDLRGRQEEARRSLRSLQDQTGLDRTVLDRQRAEMEDHVERGARLVHSFLQDELQQDVATGATPQRRDFVYPRQLNKSRSRSELLESLRRRQEELQAAMVEEEELEEELEEQEEDKVSLAEQDSPEDETCNDSSSFLDENLVFNQSKRLPFFKQKKKEAKLPSKQKAADEATLQKSRLPLRCQN